MKGSPGIDQSENHAGRARHTHPQRNTRPVFIYHRANLARTTRSYDSARGLRYLSDVRCPFVYGVGNSACRISGSEYCFSAVANRTTKCWAGLGGGGVERVPPRLRLDRAAKVDELERVR